MQIIDTLAAVGEVLSWIGLGVGIPLFLIAGMVALIEGHWEQVDIAIIDRDGVLFARWFAAGDFHERPLSAHEMVGEDDWHQGFVASRNPDSAQLHPPMIRRLMLTLGGVFVGVGVIGFVLSFLPAFI